MTRTIRNVIAVAVLGAGLAACGGGGGGGGGVAAPAATPPVVTPLEDQFGANFGGLFRAAPNTDPRDAVAADIGAVSLTTDAVTI